MTQKVDNRPVENTASGIHGTTPSGRTMVKLKHELESLAIASLYFGGWTTFLMLLKTLVLAQYQIAFHGLSLVIVGTLVLAKVVLILEHVPLGAWGRSRPAWVNILLRTLLYTVGVAVVLLGEKAFENRHAHGGFVSSLGSVFQDEDIYHV